MNLADARSYFGSEYEGRLDEPAFLERELGEYAGAEYEHVREAVLTLASFRATVRRARQLTGRRLTLAQTTGLEFLFDRRASGASWGELALHVRRRHKRAGSRNSHSLERLEQAGVIAVRHEGWDGASRPILRVELVALADVAGEAGACRYSAFACEPDESAGVAEELGLDIGDGDPGDSSWVESELGEPASITVGELVDSYARGLETPVDGDEGGSSIHVDRLIVGRENVLELRRDGSAALRRRARGGLSAAVVAVAAILALGDAAPAAAAEKCERAYRAPELIGRDWLGKPLYAEPVGLGFARCKYAGKRELVIPLELVQKTRAE